MSSWMFSARLAISALWLTFVALAEGACAAGTFDRSSYGYRVQSYSQTWPYESRQPFEYRDSYRYRNPYEYRDPFRRPYPAPWMGRSPSWNAPRSRVFSPDRGVTCDRRKEVCYKWHNKSHEWRPDRSDTKDTFGKKAARRLNQ